MMNKPNIYLSTVLILLLTSFTVNAQHFIGIKDAVGIMNVTSTPSLKFESVTKTFNPGIVYRYEHRKYYAIQAEFNYLTKGYWDPKKEWEHEIKTFELPLLAQGFIRLGWFRPYVTGGAFVGYIYHREFTMGDKTYSYSRDDYDNRFEYGIIGGAGMAFSISRFELQAEWRYQYAFSFLRDPHIEGKPSQYLNATNMMISLTLFYRLGK